MKPENLFDIDVPQLISQLTGILDSESGYGPEFKPVIENSIQLLGDIQAKRANSDTYFSLGECFLELEDTNFAIKAFHAAWMLEPANLQAGTYLGLCLEQAGSIDQAIETYLTLVKVDGQNVEMSNHVMQLVHQQNNIEKLFSIAEQLLEANPNIATPHYYRSKCYFAAGNIKQALEEISQSHTLEPDNPEYLELYLYFAYLEEHFDIVLKYETELMSDMFAISSRLMLPGSLAATGELKKARNLYASMYRAAESLPSRIQVAIEIALFHASHENNVPQSNRVNRWIVHRDSNNSLAWSNLANNTSEHHLKLEYFKKAYELEPNNKVLAMNYGHRLMLHGHLKSGFDLYDERRFVMNKSIANLIKYSDDLRDKKVLIWAEQGIGDTYIWSWLIHQLGKETNHAKVQCDPRLKSLFSRSIPNVEFVDKNLYEISQQQDLASFDANMLLISLGKYFYDDITSLQHATVRSRPKLLANKDLVNHFNLQLQSDDKRPVIGICWRSSVSDYKRESEYLHLEEIVDIFLGLPCRVLNLQYNSSSEDISFLRSKLKSQFINIEDVNLRDDQESVAAMIIACDFVFSVPTAVNALACALGKLVLSTSGTYFLGQSTNVFFPNAKSIHTIMKGRDRVMHYRKCVRNELVKLHS